MVLLSKVCTIRDRQIQENKILEENWIAEQKRLERRAIAELRLSLIKLLLDKSNVRSKKSCLSVRRL